MPYIPKERQQQLPTRFFELLPDEPTAGDMNYLFTRIAHEYIERRGLRYAHLNDVLGALDGASKEFYRRVAAQYENKAIGKNGDVMSPIIEDILYG